MRDLSIRRVVVLTAIVLVVAGIARAQSEASIVALEQNHNSWEGAQSIAAAGGSKSTPKTVVPPVRN